MERIALIYYKYNLKPFLVTQALFLLLHAPIIRFYLRIFPPEYGSIYFMRTDAAIATWRILFEAVWTVALVLNCLQIHYNDITGGRNFLLDKIRYKRGYFEMARYFKDADKYRLDTEDLYFESWKDTDGIPLGTVNGKLVKRDTDAPGNMMLFGLPGLNKTTGAIATAALRFGALVSDRFYDRSDYLCNKCIPETNGSTVVVDIKGDILHWTNGKRNIKIFNPEDPNSCHFDPFYNMSRIY